MNLSHIEHIGIAVKSLEVSIPYWEKVFGLKCYAIEEVVDQRVKTAFFMVGQTKIELLESTDPEGAFTSTISIVAEVVLVSMKVTVPLTPSTSFTFRS